MAALMCWVVPAGASVGPVGASISAVEVLGLRHTNAYVVERELYSRVGDTYTADHRRRDIERLDRLRIFSDIRHETTVVDGSVRVAIHVVETFPYLPTLSLQVSDENGVSVGPGLNSVNLFGRGVQLGAVAQFGGATNINVFIRDPWVAGNHVSYEAQFFRRDRTNVLDGFEEVAYEPDLRVGSFIGRSGRVGGRLAWTRLEADRSGITLSPDNTDDILTFGPFIGYDTRDVWSRPGTGWRNEVELTRNQVVGAGVSYWSGVFDIQRYFSVGDRHNVLLTSLTSLRSGRLGVEVPIHQDFHIGGTNTIRGWSLDSRSGKNQQITTAEYRYMLLPPRAFKVLFFSGYLGVQLAGFADLGAAWSLPEELSLSRSIGGYGVGLRVLLPFVDEVRMDVAWGEPGQGARFYFGVYPKVLVQRLRVR